MEAVPGSSLEVIEPEFFFQLLMGLFANPSRFDPAVVGTANEEPGSASAGALPRERERR